MTNFQPYELDFLNRIGISQKDDGGWFDSISQQGIKTPGDESIYDVLSRQFLDRAFPRDAGGRLGYGTTGLNINTGDNRSYGSEVVMPNGWYRTGQDYTNNTINNGAVQKVVSKYGDPSQWMSYDPTYGYLVRPDVQSDPDLQKALQLNHGMLDGLFTMGPLFLGAAALGGIASGALAAAPAAGGAAGGAAGAGAAAGEIAAGGGGAAAGGSSFFGDLFSNSALRSVASTAAQMFGGSSGSSSGSYSGGSSGGSGGGNGMGMFDNLGGLLGAGASLAPGLFALNYAQNQNNGVDVNSLQALLNQGMNAGAAPLGDFDYRTGVARNRLQSGLENRGVMGSSFGNNDISNFDTLAANQRGQLAFNTGLQGRNSNATIASQLINAQLQQKAIQNALYGRAFDVLGRSLGGGANAGLGSLGSSLGSGLGGLGSLFSGLGGINLSPGAGTNFATNFTDPFMTTNPLDALNFADTGTNYLDFLGAL